MGCGSISTCALDQGTVVPVPSHVLMRDNEWAISISKVHACRKSARKYWDDCCGPEIEEVVRSGALLLIRGSWLVSSFDAGEGIRRRQDLPAEAFLSLDELISAGILEIPLKGGLRILAASYGWLHPDHPDPKRDQLARFVQVLRAFIATDLTCGRSGVFGIVWDYMSLYQNPRTDDEEAKFREALPALNTIYAHRHTRTLMLTNMPEGWPASYDLPATANAAEYFSRGWCFGEWNMSTLVKHRRSCLDLGRLNPQVTDYDEIIECCTESSSRQAPLLPAEFTEALQKCTFTNLRDDGPRVSALYENAFQDQLGSVERLYLFGLDWGDHDAAQLAKVLKTGVCLRLEWVDLNTNIITDQGASLLASAMHQVPTLRVIILKGNPCSEQFHFIRRDGLPGKYD